LKAVNSKPKTVERYLYVFNLFYESTGLIPTSMIEEAEDDEDNNVRLRRRKINKHLKDFKEDQEKQGFSYDSITSNKSYIRLFISIMVLYCLPGLNWINLMKGKFTKS
jgi:hypothetical protein